MGCSWFLRFLLVAALLVLSSSHGLHRKLMVFTAEDGDFGSSTSAQLEESEGNSREIIEVMDYSDPGPNTNPRTGYIFTPPPRG